MKTYFMIFQVKPSPSNYDASDIENSLAHLWVVDSSLENALVTAKLYLSIYNWDLIEIEKPPTETTVDHFSHSEIGLQCFQRAQNDMVSAFFCAWPKNGSKGDYPDLRILRP